ncbi:hypothetical protein CSKR_103926 [Clonorchis sinensis]|uniref:Uncharacterized protein n=1 Tax=Clonorchis sinensis TaxID=79923 RepID=A0A3R7D526_CLOSI|nr:hypothetical protein CSKR_103926 [Clonorchis sinensis]
MDYRTNPCADDPNFADSFSDLTNSANVGQPEDDTDNVSIVNVSNFDERISISPEPIITYSPDGKQGWISIQQEITYEVPFVPEADSCGCSPLERTQLAYRFESEDSRPSVPIDSWRPMHASSEDKLYKVYTCSQPVNVNRPQVKGVQGGQNRLKQFRLHARSMERKCCCAHKGHENMSEKPNLTVDKLKRPCSARSADSVQDILTVDQEKEANVEQAAETGTYEVSQDHYLVQDKKTSGLEALSTARGNGEDQVDIAHKCINNIAPCPVEVLGNATDRESAAVQPSLLTDGILSATHSDSDAALRPLVSFPILCGQTGTHKPITNSPHSFTPTYPIQTEKELRETGTATQSKIPTIRITDSGECPGETPPMRNDVKEDRNTIVSSVPRNSGTEDPLLLGGVDNLVSGKGIRTTRHDTSKELITTQVDGHTIEVLDQSSVIASEQNRLQQIFSESVSPSSVIQSNLSSGSKEMPETRPNGQDGNILSESDFNPKVQDAVGFEVDLFQISDKKESTDIALWLDPPNQKELSKSNISFEPDAEISTITNSKVSPIKRQSQGLRTSKVLTSESSDTIDDVRKWLNYMVKGQFRLDRPESPSTLDAPSESLTENRTLSTTRMKASEMLGGRFSKEIPQVDDRENMEMVIESEQAAAHKEQLQVPELEPITDSTVSASVKLNINNQPAVTMKDITLGQQSITEGRQYEADLQQKQVTKMDLTDLITAKHVPIFSSTENRPKTEAEHTTTYEQIRPPRKQSELDDASKENSPMPAGCDEQAAPRATSQEALDLQQAPQRDVINPSTNDVAVDGSLSHISRTELNQLESHIQMTEVTNLSLPREPKADQQSTYHVQQNSTVSSHPDENLLRITRGLSKPHVAVLHEPSPAEKLHDTLRPMKRSALVEEQCRKYDSISTTEGATKQESNSLQPEHLGNHSREYEARQAKQISQKNIDVYSSSALESPNRIQVPHVISQQNKQLTQDTESCKLNSLHASQTQSSFKQAISQSTFDAIKVAKDLTGNISRLNTHERGPLEQVIGTAAQVPHKGANSQMEQKTEMIPRQRVSIASKIQEKPETEEGRETTCDRIWPTHAMLEQQQTAVTLTVSGFQPAVELDTPITPVKGINVDSSALHPTISLLEEANVTKYLALISTNQPEMTDQSLMPQRSNSTSLSTSETERISKPNVAALYEPTNAEKQLDTNSPSMMGKLDQEESTDSVGREKDTHNLNESVSIDTGKNKINPHPSQTSGCSDEKSGQSALIVERSSRSSVAKSLPLAPKILDAIQMSEREAKMNEAQDLQSQAKMLISRLLTPSNVAWDLDKLSREKEESSLTSDELNLRATVKEYSQKDVILQQIMQNSSVIPSEDDELSGLDISVLHEFVSVEKVQCTKNSAKMSAQVKVGHKKCYPPSVPETGRVRETRKEMSGIVGHARAKHDHHYDSKGNTAGQNQMKQTEQIPATFIDVDVSLDIRILSGASDSSDSDPTPRTTSQHTETLKPETKSVSTVLQSKDFIVSTAGFGETDEVPDRPVQTTLEMHRISAQEVEITGTSVTQSEPERTMPQDNPVYTKLASGISGSVPKPDTTEHDPVERLIETIRYSSGGVDLPTHSVDQSDLTTTQRSPTACTHGEKTEAVEEYDNNYHWVRPVDAFLQQTYGAGEPTGPELPPGMETDTSDWPETRTVLDRSLSSPSVIRLDEDTNVIGCLVLSPPNGLEMTNQPIPAGRRHSTMASFMRDDQLNIVQNISRIKDMPVYEQANGKMQSASKSLTKEGKLGQKEHPGLLSGTIDTPSPNRLEGMDMEWNKIHAHDHRELLSRDLSDRDTEKSFNEYRLKEDCGGKSEQNAPDFQHQPVIDKRPLISERSVDETQSSEVMTRETKEVEGSFMESTILVEQPLTHPVAVYCSPKPDSQVMECSSMSDKFDQQKMLTSIPQNGLEPQGAVQEETVVISTPEKVVKISLLHFSCTELNQWTSEDTSAPGKAVPISFSELIVTVRDQSEEVIETTEFPGGMSREEIEANEYIGQSLQENSMTLAHSITNLGVIPGITDEKAVVRQFVGGSPDRICSMKVLKSVQEEPGTNGEGVCYVKDATEVNKAKRSDIHIKKVTGKLSNKYDRFYADLSNQLPGKPVGENNAEEDEQIPRVPVEVHISLKQEMVSDAKSCDNIQAPKTTKPQTERIELKSKLRKRVLNVTQIHADTTNMGKVEEKHDRAVRTTLRMHLTSARESRKTGASKIQTESERTRQPDTTVSNRRLQDTGSRSERISKTIQPSTMSREEPRITEHSVNDSLGLPADSGANPDTKWKGAGPPVESSRKRTPPITTSKSTQKVTNGEYDQMNTITTKRTDTAAGPIHRADVQSSIRSGRSYSGRFNDPSDKIVKDPNAVHAEHSGRHSGPSPIPPRFDVPLQVVSTGAKSTDRVHVSKTTLQQMKNTESEAESTLLEQPRYPHLHTTKFGREAGELDRSSVLGISGAREKLKRYDWDHESRMKMGMKRYQEIVCPSCGEVIQRLINHDGPQQYPKRPEMTERIDEFQMLTSKVAGELPVKVPHDQKSPTSLLKKPDTSGIDILSENVLHPEFLPISKTSGKGLDEALSATPNYLPPREMKPVSECHPEEQTMMSEFTKVGLAQDEEQNRKVISPSHLDATSPEPTKSEVSKSTSSTTASIFNCVPRSRTTTNGLASSTPGARTQSGKFAHSMLSKLRKMGFKVSDKRSPHPEHGESLISSKEQSVFEGKTSPITPPSSISQAGKTQGRVSQSLATSAVTLEEKRSTNDMTDIKRGISSNSDELLKVFSRQPASGGIHQQSMTCESLKDSLSRSSLVPVFPENNPKAHQMSAGITPTEQELGNQGSDPGDFGSVSNTKPHDLSIPSSFGRVSLVHGAQDRAHENPSFTPSWSKQAKYTCNRKAYVDFAEEQKTTLNPLVDKVVSFSCVVERNNTQLSIPNKNSPTHSTKEQPFEHFPPKQFTNSVTSKDRYEPRLTELTQGGAEEPRPECTGTHIISHTEGLTEGKAVELHNIESQWCLFETQPRDLEADDVSRPFEYISSASEKPTERVIYRPQDAFTLSDNSHKDQEYTERASSMKIRHIVHQTPKEQKCAPSVSAPLFVPASMRVKRLASEESSDDQTYKSDGKVSPGYSSEMAIQKDVILANADYPSSCSDFSHDSVESRLQLCLEPEPGRSSHQVSGDSPLQNSEEPSSNPDPVDDFEVSTMSVAHSSWVSSESESSPPQLDSGTTCVSPFCGNLPVDSDNIKKHRRSLRMKLASDEMVQRPRSTTLYEGRAYDKTGRVLNAVECVGCGGVCTRGLRSPTKEQPKCEMHQRKLLDPKPQRTCLCKRSKPQEQITKTKAYTNKQRYIKTCAVCLNDMTVNAFQMPARNMQSPSPLVYRAQCLHDHDEIDTLASRCRNKGGQKADTVSQNCPCHHMYYNRTKRASHNMPQIEYLTDNFSPATRIPLCKHKKTKNGGRIEPLPPITKVHTILPSSTLPSQKHIFKKEA